MLWDTVEWWCHLVIIFSVTWADWSIHRMCERCSAYCVYCIQLVCVCAWEVASSLLSNMYLLWALKNKHSIASLLSHSHACPAYICARTHTRRTTPPSNDNINSSNPPPFFVICSLPGKADLTNHPRCQGKALLSLLVSRTRRTCVFLCRDKHNRLSDKGGNSSASSWRRPRRN